MLRLFTIILVLVLSQNSFGQAFYYSKDTIVVPAMDTGFIEEQAARFVGGNDSLNSFIGQNFVYPKEALAKNIAGTVEVEFVINEKGYLIDAKVANSINPLLDDAALKLINNMPRWQPAIYRNVPVKSYFTLPIVFELEEINLIPNKIYRSGDSSNIFIKAEFMGGQKVLQHFLATNLIYPEKSISRKEKGTVETELIILKDGTIADYYIVKNVTKLLDDECIRVITLMPKWKPATINGKSVDSYFTLPIVFEIAD